MESGIKYWMHFSIMCAAVWRTEQGIETKSFENCSNKGMLPAGIVVGESRQVEKLFIKIWCIFKGSILWCICYCHTGALLLVINPSTHPCFQHLMSNTHWITKKHTKDTVKHNLSQNFSIWILWVYVSPYDTNRAREAKFQEFSHP